MYTVSSAFRRLKVKWKRLQTRGHYLLLSILVMLQTILIIVDSEPESQPSCRRPCQGGRRRRRRNVSEKRPPWGTVTSSLPTVATHHIHTWWVCHSDLAPLDHPSPATPWCGMPRASTLEWVKSRLVLLIDHLFVTAPSQLLSNVSIWTLKTDIFSAPW